MPRGIPKNKIRIYPQWFINELREDFKDRAIDGSLTSKDRAVFICKEHGEYEQRVSEHIEISTGNRKKGCKSCGNISRAKKLREKQEGVRNFPKWFIDELVDENDKERASRGLLFSREIVKFNCEKHGAYSQRVYDHIEMKSMSRKSSCPKCVYGSHSSSYEQEIYEFLTEECKVKIERNCRGLIREGRNYYEIDLYVNDYKVGIEFNGSWYHRTDESCKDMMYHNRKFMLAEKEGIHLIQIFDVDWFDNKEKIKDYLREIFTESERIYARDTKVIGIDISDARRFCDKYHLQGKTGNDYIAYGLIYENELVAVMTFGSRRYKLIDRSYELHRFCVKKGLVVVGGASKLLRKFEERVSPEEIISYSDNDYFTGSVYPKLGFEFDGMTHPRYYWCLPNGKGVFKREQCMLKNLKKNYPETYDKFKDYNGNKEDAIMSDMGYIKVYRSGNKRWIKKYKED